MAVIMDDRLVPDLLDIEPRPVGAEWAGTDSDAGNPVGAIRGKLSAAM